MHRVFFNLVSLSLAATPSQVSAAPTAEATSYLRSALELIQSHHINRNSVNWEAITAEAYERVANAVTTADTYPAIRSILISLGEQHSGLLEPHQVGAVPSSPASEEAPLSFPLPSGRYVEGGIGLVQLPQLDMMVNDGDERGRRYTAALRAALTALDSRDLCGWIIDLRGNEGGNMWPMLQGLDPLLGEEPFGYFVRPTGTAVAWARTPTGIAGELPPLSSGGRSYSLVHQNAPVAVLIGPDTASSGEMTAISLIGRPGVRTFGAPSAGFTTANSIYPLPDGALLVITVTSVRDRTNADYRGSILPDEPSLDAERAAVSWITRDCRSAQVRGRERRGDVE